MDSQTLYLDALSEYDAGRYDKASDLFCLLSEKNPLQPEVWKGLAACSQVRKNYPEALMAWSMAALLDGQDAAPHFHAAECLVAKGETLEAKKAIRIALSLPCTEEFLDQMIHLKEVIDHA
jgi:tetratricopeptide (TPR) repeat protein